MLSPFCLIALHANSVSSFMSPLSVCSETSSFFLFLFSNPLSLLSQQKSIPVHSHCQHLPTSLFPPSFSSSCLDILYCTHTVSISFYLSLTLQVTLQLYIELVPHWDAHLLNVIDYYLDRIFSMKSFLTLSIVGEPILVVLFAKSVSRCYFGCATAS